MAVLHAKQRNALPGADFAGPNRSFPINDPNHARAALSMAHYASDPSAIRAAVHRKYPSIGARAMGGPVQAGKPYVVGEKGPELFKPKKAGTIIPHHALRGAVMTRLSAMGLKDAKGKAPGLPMNPKLRGEQDDSSGC